MPGELERLLGSLFRPKPGGSRTTGTSQILSANGAEAIQTLAETPVATFWLADEDGIPLGLTCNTLEHNYTPTPSGESLLDSSSKFTGSLLLMGVGLDPI